MPTDFSFVKPEGWEMMKPDFEKAEKKWLEKVKKKEIDQATADKIVKLMWDKYDRWSKGKGLKKKEDQTVIQRREKPGKDEPKARVSTAMVRQARIGRTQLIDILNAITDGTVDRPVVFSQTLKLNEIVPDEFFGMFAEDVRKYPQLYPKQLVAYFSNLFKDWGYGPEMEGVNEAHRGSTGPRVKAPASYERPQAKPQTPAPAAGPGQVPEAPAPGQYPTEPQPWPQGMQPPRSTQGQAYRWYFLFQLPGEQQQRAAIAEGVSREDMSGFIEQQQRAKVKIFQVKPLARAQGQAAAGPGEAAPRSEATEGKAQTGTIETPDPGDPQQYTWLMRYQTKTGHGSQSAPVMTGREVMSLMKRMEQMGVEIVELRKLNIGQESSMEEVSIRLAQGDGKTPEDQFSSGTPVIFTDDVNLEFSSLSARGPVKKNMTGRVKKVDDQNYTIDIAGQMYLVPKIVAESVMSEFKPEVVVDEGDLEGGQQEAPAPSPEAAAAAAPEAALEPQDQVEIEEQPQAPQAPAPVGGVPKTDLSKAPKPQAKPQPVASVDDGSIVVLASELEDGSITSFASTYEERWGGHFVEVVQNILQDRFGKEFGDIEVKWDGNAIADPNFEEDGGHAELPVHRRLPDGGTGPQVGTVSFDLVYAKSRAEVEEAPFDVKGIKFSPWPASQVEETQRKTEINEERPDLGDITGALRGMVVVAASMTNSDVAEAFARGGEKARSKHMFIDGDTVYSYGKHFPIATRADDGTIYFTSKNYSASTSVHKSLVRQELSIKGLTIQESSVTLGDKVGPPNPEDKAMQDKRDASEQRRQERRQKRQVGRPSEPVAEESYAPGPPAPQTGKDAIPGMGPLMKKHTVPAPRKEEPSYFNVEKEVPTMKPGQQQIVLDRLLDQLSQESDPEKRKQIEERIRSVQASIRAMMLRRAELIGIDELEQEVADRTKEKFHIKDDDGPIKNLPVSEPFSRQNTKPLNTASKSEAFADLLMLIEREAPGVPSEIGRRLYRADGAVAPHNR